MSTRLIIRSCPPLGCKRTAGGHAPAYSIEPLRVRMQQTSARHLRTLPTSLRYCTHTETHRHTHRHTRARAQYISATGLLSAAAHWPARLHRPPFSRRTVTHSLRVPPPPRDDPQPHPARKRAGARPLAQFAPLPARLVRAAQRSRTSSTSMATAAARSSSGGRDPSFLGEVYWPTCSLEKSSSPELSSITSKAPTRHRMVWSTPFLSV